MMRLTAEQVAILKLAYAEGLTIRRAAMRADVGERTAYIYFGRFRDNGLTRGVVTRRYKIAPIYDGPTMIGVAIDPPSET